MGGTMGGWDDGWAFTGIDDFFQDFTSREARRKNWDFISREARRKLWDFSVREARRNFWYFTLKRGENFEV